MSRTALTLRVFGCYLLVLGAILVIAPNFLLTLFQFPATVEVWIRVVGILAIAIGVYYLCAARIESILLFGASVYLRIFAAISFAAFASLGLVSPMLIVFGVVDLAGALWTYLAIQQEGRRKLATK